MPALDAPAMLGQLARCVEEHTGLQFSGERRRYLHCALLRIAACKGFASEQDCLEWFLGTGWDQQKSDLCAAYLTVGETYFFRERRGFALLCEVARAKALASADAPLRLWSAGCCTGEEPYSMAIMLRQAVPELAAGRISILGTDLNAANLAVARAGAYREWSFRGTDAALRTAHFTAAGDGRHVLRPKIRSLVHFAQLNLALPVYPSTATAATDIIFCRNVLMYFSPRQAALAIARMRDCLVDGGWLVVNPSEASAELFTGFRAVYHPDAIFFQKSDAALAPVEAAVDGIVAPQVPPAGSAARPEPAGANAAIALQAARMLARSGAPAAALRSLARAADEWPLAVELCQAAAEIAIEQHEYAIAQRYLKRLLYLQPDAILGHYLSALAHLGEGSHGTARRCFGTCQVLLAALADDAIVPGSDGWQAAGLRATLNALREREA
jgi:chemotaxis protein methyltransferase CheR